MGQSPKKTGYSFPPAVAVYPARQETRKEKASGISNAGKTSGASSLLEEINKVAVGIQGSRSFALMSALPGKTFVEGLHGTRARLRRAAELKVVNHPATKTPAFWARVFW